MQSFLFYEKGLDANTVDSIQIGESTFENEILLQMTEIQNNTH